MKKKWHLPFLLVLILGTWLAYQQKHPQERYIREEQSIFGTVMHVTYKAPASLADDYMDELRKVDASLSMFNPRSTLSRINRNETASCSVIGDKRLLHEIKNISTNMAMLGTNIYPQTAYLYSRIIATMFTMRK